MQNLNPLTHDQIVSRLSFGVWTMVLRQINPQIPFKSFINLEVIKLNQYVTKYQKMSDFAQTKLVFELVRKIRNRAFHIEQIKDIEIGFGRARYKILQNQICCFLDSIMIAFEGKEFFEDLMNFL